MNCRKVIIIDDERLARENLKIALKNFPQINVVGEADCNSEAKKLINEKTPEIIFLDIQLMGETGFDLLEQVPLSCHVIFVTAFNKYKIRALELNALAYLLKPVDLGELESILATLNVEKRKPSGDAAKLEVQDLIYVSARNYHRFIEVGKIKFIKSEGNYSTIVYDDNKSYIIYESMKNWMCKLPQNIFFRIHRTTILNINYLNKIIKDKVNYAILRECDTKLQISRRCYKQLLDKMK